MRGEGVRDGGAETTAAGGGYAETLDGGTDPYYIEIVPSSGPAQGGSYLVVSGRSRGGTSAHNSAVFVPQRLYIEKPRGGPTDIVLRADGDRVAVVELR